MAFTCKHLKVLALLLLTYGGANAQKKFFTEVGGLIGAGYGVNQLSLPEGKYIPMFFLAHLGKDLIDPAIVNGQRFTLIFEPQVNAVVLKHPGRNTRAAEFGLNVGLQYMLPLSKKLAAYTLITTGPHFITVHTERQAHGFIFSDNMGAGMYYKLSQTISLNTGIRIRHMSNANTRMPNHGINTVNFLMGISVTLPGLTNSAVRARP